MLRRTHSRAPLQVQPIAQTLGDLCFILKLPDELLENIAEDLYDEKNALQNLRLTCSKLRQVSLRPFARKFHSVAILPALKGSLDDALEIAEDGVFSKNVRHVTILVNEMEWSEYEQGMWDDFECPKAYRICRNKQKMDKMRNKGEDLERLTAVFGALRLHGGIESIEFIGRNTDEDWRFAGAVCGVRAMKKYNVSYDKDREADHTFHTTVKALVQSDLRPERLTIGIKGWWALSAQKIMNHPQGEVLLAKMFSHLKYLDITLWCSPLSSASINSGKQLAEAVSAATKLQTLIITYTSTSSLDQLPDEEVDDHSFVNALCLRRLPNLQRFQLAAGTVDTPSFHRLLKVHKKMRMDKATLLDVECRNMPGGRSWYCSERTWTFHRNLTKGVVETRFE